MKLQDKKRKKIDPIKIHNDYLNRLEEEIEGEDVPIFDTENGSLDIDRDYLSLPSDITIMSSRDLGNSLNAFTQQKMYLRTVLCRAENYSESARRIYYNASEYAYEEMTDRRVSEGAKERLISTKKGVCEYYNEWVDSCRKVSMVKAAIANIEDAIFLLSREVTRRGADYDEEQRDYNVGRR